MKYLKVQKSGIYEARMRVNPFERTVYRSMGTRDKDVAQKRMDAIYKQMEREAFGVASVTQAEQTASEKTLEKHLTVFLSDKDTLGLNDRYVIQLGNKLRRLFTECNWSFIKDIDKRSFNDWRARNTSLAPKTTNEYLCALQGFAKWLMENDYLTRNPIENINRVSAKKWQEDSPRALTHDEVIALLNNAGERRTVYLTAVLTGIRRGELNQLKVSDIDLGGDVPHIVIRSTVSKNGKVRTQPLHSDLTAALKVHFKGKAASDKAFEIPTWKTFQSDLKRAGIAKRNDEERKVSFHSLRHTFCTTAQTAGIDPRTVQELMGHSDIRLTTGRYTDAALLPVADAMQKMSSYQGAPRIAPLFSGSECHFVAEAGKVGLAANIAQLLGNQAFCNVLAQTAASGKWWAIQDSNL